jgi:hypothetical protein
MMFKLQKRHQITPYLNEKTEKHCLLCLFFVKR